MAEVFSSLKPIDTLNILSKSRLLIYPLEDLSSLKHLNVGS